MNWRSAGEARWLEAELPGARAVFSTRTTGSVTEGVGPLAAALRLSSESIAMSRQVHGADLAFHCSFAGNTGGKEQRREESVEADGQVVARPGIAALVFVADCLPVAVAGPGGVAILHCGWRGLAAGIVARGVEAVGATDAAIGPGIGPCCYEVGDEVLAAFASLGPDIASGRMLDLAEVARRLLREAGVERVEAAGICTRCRDDLFFSHRREADAARRQAGLAWLEPREGA